jgi:ribosomal protein L11 methyltransferase
MSGSWKASLPCTRAEAEAIDAGADLGFDPPPVLMTSEDVADDAERWRLDAYFEHEPGPAELAAVAALVPSAAGQSPRIEALADADWVTLSQAGLEPLAVGRFVVHTSAYPATPPLGGRAFLIEASQAFGTGHHETTSGCLAALDRMAASERFANIVDLGTGTGLLAFAARHLWPAAQVLATDIDAIAIDVTRDNARLNAVEGVALAVADGARGPEIAARMPFDLVIANILAGPLIAMAPEIAAIAAPGARILLAGLLTVQAEAVAGAYRDQGCTLVASEARGDWTILELRAGAVAPDMPVIDDPRRRNWALDL